MAFRLGDRVRPWALLGGSPSGKLLFVALICLAAAAAAARDALDDPWLGTHPRLTHGEVRIDLPDGRAGRLLAVRSPAGAMAVRPTDLTEDPDVFPTYAQAHAFRARQSALTAILSRRPLEMDAVLPAGAVARLAVTQRARPVRDLPISFWVQVLTGVGGFLIGGWIWALRPADWACRLFALSGLGLMVSALSGAVYSSRELAIAGDEFRLLNAMNFLGAQVFASALIGLFLFYPRRLLRPAWLWFLPILLVPIGTAATMERLVSPVFDVHAPILAAVAVILALIGVQWRATRGDPASRAALTWLGLSVAVGCGAFAASTSAPILLGSDLHASQGYSFGFFLLIYLGLALGLRRHRLFEVREWGFRVLFFAVAILLLLGLDSTLVLMLRGEKTFALGVSLVIVGFLYLPLRDVIWRRLTLRRGMQEDELFAAALGVAMAPEGGRADRWRALLQRLFDPLEITEAAPPPQQAAILADGTVLVLPAVAEAPALRLAFPRAGRGLFSPSQAKLAGHLAALTRQVQTSREAYERGAAEERGRMARDLHDDVASRLMSGLQAADEPTRSVLHAALSDIRAIVSGLVGERAPLQRVLAEARHEASRRLQGAGIALDWPTGAEDDEGPLLDYRLRKALASALRESVANTVRHSGASLLAVRASVAGGALTLVLCDDGRGLPPAALQGTAPGQGLGNLRQRALGVGGTLLLANGEKGAKITLVIPLS